MQLTTFVCPALYMQDKQQILTDPQNNMQVVEKYYYIISTIDNWNVLMQRKMPDCNN